MTMELECESALVFVTEVRTNNRRCWNKQLKRDKKADKMGQIHDVVAKVSFVHLVLKKLLLF